MVISNFTVLYFCFLSARAERRTGSGWPRSACCSRRRRSDPHPRPPPPRRPPRPRPRPAAAAAALHHFVNSKLKSPDGPEHIDIFIDMIPLCMSHLTAFARWHFCIVN
jgi:hypothetical protein